MIDDVERGQEAAQQFTDDAIAAARARIAASFEPRDPAVERQCIDCDAEIEPERLQALGKTSRCAACAHEHARLCRGKQ